MGYLAKISLLIQYDYFAQGITRCLLVNLSNHLNNFLYPLHKIDFVRSVGQTKYYKARQNAPNMNLYIGT